MHRNPDATRDNELVNSILEFKQIVNTAAFSFDRLDKVLRSLQKNKLIDDPNKLGEYEYKTYTGQFILNMFKSYGLNKETNKLFVENVGTWNAFAALMVDEVTAATKGLAEHRDFSSAKQALLNLTNANRPDDQATNMMVVYLANFASVFTFVNSWNTLDKGVKKAINENCKKEFNLGVSEVDSLFTHPFQHITRLQLHLNVMAKALDKYPEDEQLKAIAQRFHETSNMLQEQITSFNAKVAQSGPKQQ